MSEKADAARFIAKLLAKRRTSIEEIPSVIENVHRALATLGVGQARQEEEIPTEAKPPSRPKRQSAARKPRRIREKQEPAAVAPAPMAEPDVKIPQSKLVRRAEAIQVAPVTPPPPLVSTPSNGNIRGVVQWFDSRTGQGTLRLPGLSHDLPVDAATLSSFNITRLFKGQEIDATVDNSGDAPKLTALHLANTPAAAPISGGMVRDRHAKPVVVELKREAMSRSAARAEAEMLLRPRRVR